MHPFFKIFLCEYYMLFSFPGQDTNKPRLNCPIVACNSTAETKLNNISNTEQTFFQGFRKRYLNSIELISTVVHVSCDFMTVCLKTSRNVSLPYFVVSYCSYRFDTSLSIFPLCFRYIYFHCKVIIDGSNNSSFYLSRKMYHTLFQVSDVLLALIFSQKKKLLS